jgi:hypothetical protein
MRAEKIAKFLEGVSSLISIYPLENNRKIHLPDTANNNGFKSDWSKIGQDMWYACRTVEIPSKESKDNNDRLEQHNP